MGKRIEEGDKKEEKGKENRKDRKYRRTLRKK
jgi:hypothetical protein